MDMSSSENGSEDAHFLLEEFPRNLQLVQLHSGNIKFIHTGTISIKFFWGNSVILWRVINKFNF